MVLAQHASVHVLTHTGVLEPLQNLFSKTTGQRVIHGNPRTHNYQLQIVNRRFQQCNCISREQDSLLQLFSCILTGRLVGMGLSTHPYTACPVPPPGDRSADLRLMKLTSHLPSRWWWLVGFTGAQVATSELCWPNEQHPCRSCRFTVFACNAP